MRLHFRHGLIAASIILGGTSPFVSQAFAQTSISVDAPPQQPTVSVPRRPAPPIVDDVMTLGTPSPEANTAASTPAPTIARPEVRPTDVAPSPYATSVEALGRIVTGVAKVLDGNTIAVGGETIVLHGADAFESRQTCNDLTGMTWSCGEKATRKLSEFVGGRVVHCVGVENLEGAITAFCSIKGEDLGAAMVSEGYAFVAPGTSGYESNQQRALSAQRGGWMGTFDYPWIIRSNQ